jgi:hypothetical protein
MDNIKMRGTNMKTMKILLETFVLVLGCIFSS